MANILVVDDEIGIRELLSEILSDEGHLVFCADSAAQAKQLRSHESVDLVLLDIWMPECDGITLLKEWVAQGMHRTPVIMMSGHATIDTAVEATRFGALDFLEKPITLQKLLSAVQKGLTRNQLNRLAASLSVASKLEATPEHTAINGFTPPALSISPIDLDMPLREARDEFERMYFEHHLARENYSMTRVAERTGLERTHLYRKLKHLGVELSRQGRRNVSNPTLSLAPQEASLSSSEPLNSPPSRVL